MDDGVSQTRGISRTGRTGVEIQVGAQQKQAEAHLCPTRPWMFNMRILRVGKQWSFACTLQARPERRLSTYCRYSYGCFSVVSILSDVCPVRVWHASLPNYLACDAWEVRIYGVPQTTAVASVWHGTRKQVDIRTTWRCQQYRYMSLEIFKSCVLQVSTKMFLELQNRVSAKLADRAL